MLQVKRSINEWARMDGEWVDLRNERAKDGWRWERCLARRSWCPIQTRDKMAGADLLIPPKRERTTWKEATNGFWCTVYVKVEWLIRNIWYSSSCFQYDNEEKDIYLCCQRYEDTQKQTDRDRALGKCFGDWHLGSLSSRYRCEATRKESLLYKPPTSTTQKKIMASKTPHTAWHFTRQRSKTVGYMWKWTDRIRVRINLIEHWDIRELVLEPRERTGDTGIEWGYISKRRKASGTTKREWSQAASHVVQSPVYKKHNETNLKSTFDKTGS